MRVIGFLGGLALIVLTLVDGFEVILQSRRISHRFRYVRLFYRAAWHIWRALALHLVRAGRPREAFLSLFGFSSLLALFGTWVMGLIFGFGLVQWSLASPLHFVGGAPSLGTYLYLSGTTFFTLGYGDVTPAAPGGRVIAVLESGLGFAFLALIISYLPVLYNAFSRREQIVLLVAGRAGSPPTAGQLLLRFARAGKLGVLDAFLAECERWSAELLESHVSFPVLSYFRSQHDNQSYLAVLATILDTCALLLSKVPWEDPYQAQLTFALARHAVIDLPLVLNLEPVVPGEDRWSAESVGEFERAMRDAGVEMIEGPAADAALAQLRGQYEPLLNAMARRFLMALPTLVAAEAEWDAEE